VLQSVVECCRVLQYVSVDRSRIRAVQVSMLQCVAVCCSLLQSVTTVCCSVLQSGALCLPRYE